MEFAGETAMGVGVKAGPANERGAPWAATAFEAVFRDYYSKIVAVLYRIVGDRARAEELASDAFLKLYREPAAEDRFSNIGGWLYRTATHLGLDALRAAQRRHRHEPEAAGRLAQATDTPLDEALRAERSSLVRIALSKLKPIQSQALMLRAEGLSYKEIAGSLSINPASVGTTLLRAEAAFEKAYRRAERRGA